MDTLELVVKWPVRESKQLSGVRRVKTQLESSRVVSNDPRDKHVGQQLFHHRVSLHTGPPMSDAVALCSGVCNNGTYDYHNASEDTCSTHRYIEMQPRLDTSSSISSILCENPTLLCSTEPEYEVMVKKPDYDPGYEIMQPAMNSDPAANHVEVSFFIPYVCSTSLLLKNHSHWVKILNPAGATQINIRCRSTRINT